MDYILDEIKNALKNKNYFIALQSTLTLPDICACLEKENGEATKNDYIKWFDENYKRRYTTHLTGLDCYKYRCFCLHSGSIKKNCNSKKAKETQYDQVFFLYPNSGLNAGITMHNNVFELNGIKTLNLDINIFCEEMIQSVRTWEKTVEKNQVFKNNYERLMKVRRNVSLAPFIGPKGFDVIA